MLTEGRHLVPREDTRRRRWRDERGNHDSQVEEVPEAGAVLDSHSKDPKGRAPDHSLPEEDGGRRSRGRADLVVDMPKFADQTGAGVVEGKVPAGLVAAAGVVEAEAAADQVAGSR